MRIEHSLAGLRAALAGDRQVGFVATMGGLHEGHLALVHEARNRVGSEGKVAASIFVNRLQFAGGEDFERYPRTFERDCMLLREAGCDLLFAPDEAVMYPEPQTFIVVPDPALAGILEGASRPGHFSGMCTVVMKLFTMVRPTLAMFGAKDYQQLLLIRHMTRQFALPLQIVAHPTVRESDGLAMSSRNVYLSPAERAEAPALNRVLRELVASVRGLQARQRQDISPEPPRPPANGAAASVVTVQAPRRTGDFDAVAALDALAGAAVDALRARGWQPDYVSVRRRADLLPPTDEDLRSAEPLGALAAARLGTPRLLDNIEI